VTHTTRKPRVGEIDGVDYHYICTATFQDMVARGEFLEHAVVHGNNYGVSIEAWTNVTKAQKICIVEVDVQGIQHIKEISVEKRLSPHYLFVEPPTVDILHFRLLERGTETDEDIRLRLANAKMEIEHARRDGFVDKIICNDDFGNATNALFRTVRDWYPALPSAARLGYLRRQMTRFKEARLAEATRENKYDNKTQNDGDVQDNSDTNL